MRFPPYVELPPYAGFPPDFEFPPFVENQLELDSEKVRLEGAGRCSGMVWLNDRDGACPVFSEEKRGGAFAGLSEEKKGDAFGLEKVQNRLVGDVLVASTFEL